MARFEVSMDILADDRLAADGEAEAAFYKLLRQRLDDAIGPSVKIVNIFIRRVGPPPESGGAPTASVQ